MSATTDLTTRLSMREKIRALQDAFAKVNPDGFSTASSYPVHHEVLDGLYVRSTSIPQGHLVLGKIHRYNNITIIKQGMALVVSENFPTVRLFKAGDQLVVPAHNANVLVTLTDVVWTTCHPLDKEFESIEALEKHLIIPDFDTLNAEFNNYIEHKE